jgi:CheY-like chemotaxis protein
MSGIELCRQLRQEPRWQNLHLIAYTAHAMSDEQQTILQAGFNAIVTKPLTRDSLVAALDSIKCLVTGPRRMTIQPLPDEPRWSTAGRARTKQTA